MGKKLLVIGSGGREHALCWKLAQSPLLETLYCAPGSAGIAQAAKLADIPADDVGRLLSFAKSEKIDLTVVGPEAPLTLGIVDAFRAAGLRIFGPTQAAAQLEGSKAFAKDLMRQAGIPTAGYQIFENADDALADLRERKGRVAIKASGLAQGKGVLLPANMEEAVEAIDRILTRREFGDAGAQVVIEDFLVGEELSVLALCDGDHALLLESAQDHKALLDGDQGPNTGGMGAYSPAPLLTPELTKQIEREVFRPTLKAMKKAGSPFQGVLYAGLMITAEGPKVLEYNVRFGDPECQALLPRLESDLIPLLEASIDGTLKKQKADWKREASVCVVLCSKGYPGDYEKGKAITGLDAVAHEAVQVFHAGTRKVEGQWQNAGGRVLGVTAQGRTLADAVSRVYENVRKIRWEGAHYRADIGKKGLRRLAQEAEAPKPAKGKKSKRAS